VQSPTRSLAGLVSTAVVVTIALGWAGWRLLDQQRAIDEQRARDRLENTADAVAAGFLGRLAETGERLSAWVSSPSSALPAVDGAVVVGIRPDRIDVYPTGGLPFLPVAIRRSPPLEVFASLEAMEFGGSLERARAEYQALAGDRNPSVQAGGLLRLGRVQRRTKDFAGALITYQRLVQLGAVDSGDLPAELAGLLGQRSTYLAMANPQHANVVGRQILNGLDSGRWPITRGAAELYREPFTEERPELWTLASALSDVWRDMDVRVPARGHRVIGGTDRTASRVLVLWRSTGTSTAALAVRVDRFFALPASTADWQLTDPEGHLIGGAAARPSRSVARVIGNMEYPWTLYTWTGPRNDPGARNSRRIMFAMMGATLALVWAALYFTARALRREADVARLQSDFVSAVSHEFRSPLTTVRQLAEMLDQDRVATDERRHRYYRILAAEAARLQRLVETLLDFGRMEAGAERYRFVDLDAVALVRGVVADVTERARESGKAIEADGPEAALPVRADLSALSLALSNLIDNAIKYSPGEPTVWVRWHKDRGCAAISVVDRGVGIPRAEQQTIFAKFVRGRAAVDANIRGTGVGLSIAQQIVAAHGGEIHLESEPGRGSTFTLLLPGVN
jgi:signal transduction histidine kinase